MYHYIQLIKVSEFQKFNILLRFQKYIIDILFIYSSFLLPRLVISNVNYMETWTVTTEHTFWGRKRF